jgi:general stress protein YciG
MSAQPPHHPRTAEIDIREVLAATESDNDRATADSSAHWIEPGSRALSGKNLLRRYYTARFGWSGWTNVVFAALTAIGALFWALRGFDSYERLRSIHARASEYIYPRPAPGDQAARNLAETGPDSARTGRPDSNSTSTTFNGSSVPHPFTDQSGNAPLPPNPNPGFTNGSHPDTATNSTRTNEAGSGRSFANGRTVASNVAAKGGTRSSSRTKKNDQSERSKCGTTSLGLARGGAPISKTGPAKSNQSSIAHPLNSAVRSGLGSGLRGLGGGRGGR